MIARIRALEARSALQLVASGHVPGPTALAGHAAVVAAAQLIGWLALRPAGGSMRTATAWQGCR